MGERIMKLLPEVGKQGIDISRPKYCFVREIINAWPGENEQMMYSRLRAGANWRLQGRLAGSISWRFTTVKVDLQTRDILERVGRGTPRHMSPER